jgi:uroporphyrinogen decarboxylase
MRRHRESGAVLTHHERVALALDHRETDRVPIAMVCSGINAPAYRELEAHLARERGLTVEQFVEPLLDIRSLAPRYVGPTLGPGEDIWGVVRRPVSYGAGSYEEICHHPLAAARSVDDLERHRWPRAEWFDYAALEPAARDSDGYCLMVSGGNPFETTWYLRGLEQTFADLALDPEMAGAILARVTAFFVEHTRRQLAAARGRIDLVFTADDIGGQQGLLFSPTAWEQQIRPWHVILNKAVHEFGARVIYHSDGAVMRAVPGLIAAGVDVLQALQFDARDMDPVRLKSDYGDRLCFEGGISVQSTLPFGTADDVRNEVEERIRVLGRGGGYILGPSHAIQAGTPPENVVAMFDHAARPLRG